MSNSTFGDEAAPSLHRGLSPTHPPIGIFWFRHEESGILWAGHTSSTYLLHPWGNIWTIGFGSTHTGGQLSTLPRAQHLLSAPGYFLLTLAIPWVRTSRPWYLPRALGSTLGCWTNASASLPTIHLRTYIYPLSQPYYFYIGELASLGWLFNTAPGWIYGGRRRNVSSSSKPSCLFSSQPALFLISVFRGWSSQKHQTKQEATDEGLWL